MWALDRRLLLALACGSFVLAPSHGQAPSRNPSIGREAGVAVHLKDDDEFRTPLDQLIAYGKELFIAKWTVEDGAGRPLLKGNGRALSDPTQPLTGARAYNRLSGPDANSCVGCHNAPHGTPGGAGDFASAAFVGGYRYDYLTLDASDNVPTKGTRDEWGRPATVQSFADLRVPAGLFGSGYIEMLARQITADLQAIRGTLRPGQSKPLVSKGVSFGVIGRDRDGLWDTSRVEGISKASLITATSLDPPTLIIRPWRQSGSAISLRELTNDSFNEHLGIQSSERFGVDVDLDGDGIKNELTRADVTAIVLYEATLAVPGRVIPNDPEIEAAVLSGERRFETLGCASCHVPKLPLDKSGWIYDEPNPYNPMTNLRRGEANSIRVDLNSQALPSPRLARGRDGTVWVPAYTDLKLHDITTGPADPYAEPLDLNIGSWSVAFTKGNRKFLTKRLWGCANQPPYFHHGLFTTLRQSVLAHSGEALSARQGFESLAKSEQDEVIEFLKSLQVLPPGARSLFVDEQLRPRAWPPSKTAGRTK
jgi:cytochrome c peroxidase